ncbi:contractile injection system tape measure protein [Undibacterium baiyunense]|uniref:Uncharacterized protein n=1 Tax=Undibacterium baiyunense TaxID=2828731 RepID=A0A941DCS1_9BURK|nr:contractile injection system tape measure protein [Undibacterium baiyunense]MBR7745651.1 hypothetical protein [Undibacterium baiyunense]
MRRINRIHDLVFDLSFSDEKADASVWAEWVKMRLLPIIDEVMEDLSREFKISASQVRRIESLEIDLGSVFVAESERELVRRLHEQFSNSLRQALTKIGAQNSSLEQVDNAHTDFLHFLKTGQLKWERLSDAKHAHKRLLHEIIHAKSAPLPLHEITRDNRQLNRLLKQFDVGDLFKITNMALRSWSREERELMLDWLGLEFLHLQTKHSEQAAIEKLWQFILPSIQNRSNSFAEIAQSWMAFQGSSLTTIKTEYQYFIETHTAISTPTRVALMQVLERISKKLANPDLVNAGRDTFEQKDQSTQLANELAEQYRAEIANARNAEQAMTTSRFAFTEVHKLAFQHGDFSALESDWASLILFCANDIRQLHTNYWPTWLEKFPTFACLDLISVIHNDAAWFIQSSLSTKNITSKLQNQWELDAFIVTCLSSPANAIPTSMFERFKSHLAANLGEYKQDIHKDDNVRPEKLVRKQHEEKFADAINQISKICITSDDPRLISNAIHLLLDEHAEAFEAISRVHWRRWWQLLDFNDQVQILLRIHPQLTACIQAYRSQQLRDAIQSTTERRAYDTALFAYLWVVPANQLSSTEFEQWYKPQSALSGDLTESSLSSDISTEKVIASFDKIKTNKLEQNITPKKIPSKHFLELFGHKNPHTIEPFFINLSIDQSREIRSHFIELTRSQKLDIIDKMSLTQSAVLTQVLHPNIGKLLQEQYQYFDRFYGAIESSLKRMLSGNQIAHTIPNKENLFQQLIKHLALSETSLQVSEFRNFIASLLGIPGDLRESFQESILEEIEDTALPYFVAVLKQENQIKPTPKKIGNKFQSRPLTTSTDLEQSSLIAPNHPLLRGFHAWRAGKFSVSDLNLQLRELHMYLHWWVLHQDTDHKIDYSLLLKNIQVAVQSSPIPEHLLACTLDALRDGESINLDSLNAQARALDAHAFQIGEKNFAPSALALKLAIDEYYQRSTNDSNPTAKNSSEILYTSELQANFLAAFSSNENWQAFQSELIQQCVRSTSHMLQLKAQLREEISAAQLHRFIVRLLERIQIDHLFISTDISAGLHSTINENDLHHKLQLIAIQSDSPQARYTDILIHLLLQDTKQLVALLSSVSTDASSLSNKVSGFVESEVKSVFQLSLTQQILLPENDELFALKTRLSKEQILLPADLRRKMQPPELLLLLKQWLIHQVQQVVFRQRKIIEDTATNHPINRDTPFSNNDQQELTAKYHDAFKTIAALLTNLQQEDLPFVLSSLRDSLPLHLTQQILKLSEQYFEIGEKDLKELNKWIACSDSTQQLRQVWESPLRLLYSIEQSTQGATTTQIESNAPTLHQSEQKQGQFDTLSSHQIDTLPAKLTDAVLHARIISLEKIWPQILQGHKHLLAEVQRKYLVKQELREHLITHTPINMLVDMLESIAPNSAELLRGLWLNWDLLDSKMRRYQTYPDFQRHSLRSAFAGVFEMALHRRDITVQADFIISSIYATDRKHTEVILSHLSYQMDVSQSPPWQYVFEHINAVNMFKTFEDADSLDQTAQGAQELHELDTNRSNKNDYLDIETRPFANLAQLGLEQHDHSPKASASTTKPEVLQLSTKQQDDLVTSCLMQLNADQLHSFWNAYAYAFCNSEVNKVESSLEEVLQVTTYNTPALPLQEKTIDQRILRSQTSLRAALKALANLDLSQIDTVSLSKHDRSLIATPTTLQNLETICLVILQTKTSIGYREQADFQKALHRLLSQTTYHFKDLKEVLQSHSAVSRLCVNRLCELASESQLDALFRRMHNSLSQHLPTLIYRLENALQIQLHENLIHLSKVSWRAIYVSSLANPIPLDIRQFTAQLIRQLQLSFKLESIEACIEKLKNFDHQLETRISMQIAERKEKARSPEPNLLDQRTSSNTNKVSGDDEQILQGSFLQNAGLVIVAPYLQRLFSLLSLTKDGAFVDRQAAERAVHLTQYIVTGEEASPEFMLTLNKLLCGIPAVVPISNGIQLSAHEKEVIQQMLSGVITHWSAIGKTSIQGLRETFLIREGYLNYIEDSWHLKVRQGSFDMLLDRLPWSFAMIKYPWMLAPLHVTWR